MYQKALVFCVSRLFTIQLLLGSWLHVCVRHSLYIGLGSVSMVITLRWFRQLNVKMMLVESSDICQWRLRKVDRGTRKELMVL